MISKTAILVGLDYVSKAHLQFAYAARPLTVDYLKWMLAQNLSAAQPRKLLTCPSLFAVYFAGIENRTVVEAEAEREPLRNTRRNGKYVSRNAVDIAG